MDNFKEIIAKNLIMFRTKAKLSQLELAQKINYSDKSISKWERGLGLPDCIVLKQLAEIYDIKVDDFFVENENSKNIKIDNLSTKKSKRILITMLSCGLVWLVATLLFVALKWLKIDFAWVCFIFAIPVSFIVLIIFASLWWRYYVIGIYASLLSWSIAFSFNISFPHSKSYLLYLICIPMQILIILWVIFKYIKKRHIK